MVTVLHYFGRFGDGFQQMLDELGVKYDVLHAPFPEDQPPVIVFDLKTSSTRFDEQYATISGYAQPLSVLTKYDQQEMADAPWLAIFPHRHCVEILNRDEAFFYCCSPAPYSRDKGYQHDQEQLADLRIAKIPPRTKTVFYAGDTGLGEIFADERLVGLAEAHGIEGLQFRQVLNRKGQVRADFYQITSDRLITRAQVSLGHGEKYSECPCCYSRQIVLADPDLLHLNGKPEALAGDFCMTESIFGEGIAHPYYLISQRFYRILKENRMLTSVRIEPVCFADGIHRRCDDI